MQPITRDYITLGSAAALVAASALLFRSAERSGSKPHWSAWATGLSGAALALYAFERPRLLTGLAVKEPDKESSTAVQKSEASATTLWAMEKGLLSPPVLDWGSGYGEDVAYLKEIGVEAVGYDPTHQPHLPPQGAFGSAQVAHVIDIISDPSERVRTLGQLRSHLAPGANVVISAATPEAVNALIQMMPQAGFSRYGDGWASSAGTFIRGFDTQELAAVVQQAGLRFMAADTITEDGSPTAIVYAKA